jgi:stage II sporulation protein E
MVLNEVNRIAKTYLSYESAMKSEDESRLVISNELENFSNIFANFSVMLNNFSILNEKLSMILKDSLLNNMVDIKEVAIFENKNGIKYINIISNNEQILRKEMKDTIQRVIKNNVKLKEVKHIEYSGLSYATFLPVNKIQVDFAVVTKSKEQKNGDNVIIQKIDDNKYFVAIADGMGHGEKANKISSMVLSLIKSLFEVGFNEDLVIQSVNKLLLPAGLDNFTTLDACVIDLESEFITFVKLGSSVSVIKHRNTSELVKCESLPIGMIQNIKPTIVKKQIIANDMIFLASDGIVDSFSSVDNYKNFINDAKIFDIKKFLDDVVFDAEYSNTKHKDDMTIIGINLLKNSKK